MKPFNPKPRPCSHCAKPFTPVRAMQSVCSPRCAAQKVKKQKAEERSETRKKLQALDTLPKLKKRTEGAFNAFVRARDAGKPCISCGKPLGNEPNSFDAGHYRSVGSAPHMRFVETNVHGQCKHCNRYLSGNHVAYRQGLVHRVGLEEVERIESDQTTRHYTKEDLIELARQYREMTRNLKGSRT